MQKRKLCSVADYFLLHTGDIVLLRGGGGPWSWPIQLLTRSKYWHAGIIYINDGVVMVMEMDRGGLRAVSLANYLRMYRGCIDVFRPAATVHRMHYSTAWRIVRSYESPYRSDKVIAAMQQLSGCRYGWLNVVLHALLRVFPVQFLFANSNDCLELKKLPPHCSQLVSYCLRKGWVDVVPGRADLMTTPKDLSRSPLLHYLFTLT